MNLENNKVYKVNHSRKGRFTMRTTDVSNDTWVTGEIVDGKTRTMLPENSRSEGETITVRKSFCKFEEII